MSPGDCNKRLSRDSTHDPGDHLMNVSLHASYRHICTPTVSVLVKIRLILVAILGICLQ